MSQTEQLLARRKVATDVAESILRWRPTRRLVHLARVYLDVQAELDRLAQSVVAQQKATARVESLQKTNDALMEHRGNRAIIDMLRTRAETAEAELARLAQRVEDERRALALVYAEVTNRDGGRDFQILGSLRAAKAGLRGDTEYVQLREQAPAIGSAMSAALASHPAPQPEGEEGK